MLSNPHLHRIARHEADRNERQKHQRQKRRDCERDSAKKIDEHGRPENAVPRPSARRSAGPALLEIDALKGMRPERALLVACHVGAHRFVDG